MHVTEPRQFNLRRITHSRRSKRPWVVLTLAIIMALSSLTYGYAAINANLPQLEPVVTANLGVAPVPVDIPWPNYGQVAMGAVGYGVLASSKADASPVPMASVAKIITALAVMEKKPFISDQPGASITITAADVALYNSYVTKQGSVVPVNEGEVLTQYQAMQAILLPSANNVADSLAVWAFGSMENYVTYANDMVTKMGLTKTHVADASGFSPQTVSTATDLVKLGQKALGNDVIADIVSQSEATLPVVGVVKNVNRLLANKEFVGIKTGSTDQAGGCYLFAVKRSVDGNNVTLIGAILGAPTRELAFQISQPIMEATFKGFITSELVKKDTVLGHYQTSWGTQTEIVAQQDLKVFGWHGAVQTPAIHITKADAGAAAGTVVGNVEIMSGDKLASVSAVTKQTIPRPSLSWRLWHYRSL